VLKQAPRVQRGEPPSLTGQIRDDDVRVQLRITRPREAVTVRSSDKPLTAQPLNAAVSATGPARLPLQIRHRRGDRPLVRVNQRLRDTAADHRR
jgi:hypothetical protein